MQSVSVSLIEDEAVRRSGGSVVSIISNLDPKWNEILAKCSRLFAIRPKNVPGSEIGIHCLVIFLSTSVYECCNLHFKYVRRHNAIYSRDV